MVARLPVAGYKCRQLLHQDCGKHCSSACCAQWGGSPPQALVVDVQMSYLFLVQNVSHNTAPHGATCRGLTCS